MSGKWQAGGFAARGHRHVLKDQPCQDAIRIGSRRFDHGEALVLAVADGHGSARFAQAGAALAVDVAVERLLDFYAALLPELHSPLERGTRLNRVLELALAPTRRQLVQDWAERVAMHAQAATISIYFHQCVQDWAERVAMHAAEAQGLELLKQYGTTLIFVLAAPEFVLFGQIGDGDVLLTDPGGGAIRPLPGDPQSFADETASLCQKEAWVQMRLAIQPPPSGPCLLLLTTDGYANSYENDAAFEGIGPDYLKLVREYGLERVEGFLPKFLEQVSQRGSGDDVTLGLAYFTPDEHSEQLTPLEQPCPAEPVSGEQARPSEALPSAATDSSERASSGTPSPDIEESSNSGTATSTPGRSSRWPDM